MLVIRPELCSLFFDLQQLRVLSGPLGHSPRNVLAVPQRHVEGCSAATESFRVRGSSHPTEFFLKLMVL